MTREIEGECKVILLWVYEKTETSPISTFSSMEMWDHLPETSLSKDGADAPPLKASAPLNTIIIIILLAAARDLCCQQRYFGHYLYCRHKLFFV